jgi:hypothetical protein
MGVSFVGSLTRGALIGEHASGCTHRGVTIAGVRLVLRRIRTEVSLFRRGSKIGVRSKMSAFTFSSFKIRFCLLPLAFLFLKFLNRIWDNPSRQFGDFRSVALNQLCCRSLKAFETNQMRRNCSLFAVDCGGRDSEF